MSEARQAPEGCQWRPSVLPHICRVWVLELVREARQIGSIEPVPGGKWMNRETGEVFATQGQAKASVEQWAKP